MSLLDTLKEGWNSAKAFISKTNRQADKNVDILMSAPTDTNILKDVYNKWDVMVATTGYDTAGTEIRNSLYEAYQTGGYDAFNALRDKYYSPTPQVYESDLGVAKELHNSRYQVHTVKDDITLSKMTNALNNGTLEMRILDERGTRNAYDTAYGTRNMGREKLVGINNKDRYVLYDSATGQYYRYRNEDDADYKQLQEELEAYEKLYDAQLANIEAVQAHYIEALQKTSGAQYTALYEEYADKYEKLALSANATANKLVRLRAEIVPDKTFIDNVNATIDQYDQQRIEYNKYNKYIADFNDPYQFNSLADVLKELFHDTDKRPWLENLKELYHYSTAYLNTDELSVKDKATVGFQNILVNFGESMDIIATPVKALINGPAHGMTSGEAFKASIGLSDGGGYYNFDYDTGFLPVDLALEILSDPATYVTGGVTAVGDVAVEALPKTVKASVAKFGIEISDDLATQISKTAVRNVRVSNKPIGEALKDATINALTKQDVHKKLANLGDETLPFLEANRAAKVLIDSGYVGKLDKTTTQLYKLLEGTNLSPANMEKVLKLSQDSWNTLSDAASYAAKKTAVQKAARAVAATQTLNRLDDTYARVVRNLTVAPIVIPYKGVNWITKRITGVGLSTHAKEAVLKMWNSIKHINESNLVKAEAAMINMQEQADSVIAFIRELNSESDEAIEELVEASQQALAQTHNQKVSKVIDTVEQLVTQGLAQADYDKLTKAEVFELFNNAARTASGGAFDYAQLFAFMHNESAFAKMLNDANKNAYKKLNKMRNMLSEHADIVNANDLYRTIGNAIERMNKVRVDFNNQFGNDIPLRIVEDSHRVLTQTLNVAEFGDTMSTKLQDLDNIVHDLRWYATNEGAIPDNVQLQMYMTLREINDEVVQKFSRSTDAARIAEVDADIAKAFKLQNEDAIIVQRSTLNDTVTTIQKMFGEDGTALTEDEIGELIIKELDKHKLKNTDEDYIRISVSNVARKLAVYNNPHISSAFNSAIDLSTPMGKVIDAATNIVDDTTTTGYAIKCSASTMHTYRLEQMFMEDLNKLGTNTGLAVHDTLTDEVLSRANGVIRNMDCTSAASIELATNRITEYIIEGTQEHMQGVSDEYIKMALMHNTDDAGKYFTLNSVNTEQNVINMMSASSDLLNKGREAIANDAYRDVYYSIAHTSTYGNPIRVSFGDSVTGEVRTFTLHVDSGTLDISDDVARKMFGLNDAREFKTQMQTLITDDAYTYTQDYYQAINEYLSNIVAHTTGGKQVRFVGFNTGMTRTNQEAVFKQVRNKYNMVVGPFVDLGETIRKIEFPDVYLSDEAAELLQTAVYEHVNRIAKVQTQYGNLDLRFGNTAEDLTNGMLTIVSDDVLRFSKDRITKDIPSMAISNMLENADLSMLYNQAQDVKKAVVYARAAVKKVDVPDDMEVLVNLSRLREMYELKTGQKLNVMNVLRKTQGEDVNIRYVYQADEAKRWFKSDAVKALDAQALDSLHRAYKGLINYEQRIKEVHISEMFHKKDLIDMYHKLYNRMPASAKYDIIYPALKMLDLNKMSNNQILSAIFAVRKFTEFTYKELETMNELIFLVHNYREFLTKGLDIVALTDAAKFNKFNILSNVCSWTGVERVKLERLYDDVRASEEYIRLLERNYGRTTEGMDLVATHNLSRSLKQLTDDYTQLRDSLAMYSSSVNGNTLIKTDEIAELEGKLHTFMDELDAAAETLTASSVLNLSTMTPEQLHAHILGNCSGTLVLQLDSKALRNYITQTEQLIKTVDSDDAFEVVYKDLNISGVAHPALVVNVGRADSDEVIRQALKLVDEMNISVEHLPNKDLVENLPNRFKLSDYTPANVAATRRVLEFAGKSSKDANDIIQVYQRLKVFDAGCNNNVIGDHAFVKQFYTEKASNYLKSAQQMVMHNMNHIGGLTYYTNIIRSGMYDLSSFVIGSTTHKQLVELLNTYHYVVCALTEDGTPVKVALTDDVFKHAHNYSCVPEEWFKEMQDAYEAFKNKNIMDNRNSVHYKRKVISAVATDIMNLRKQGWLFTNTATAINNLIGGGTNFVSDTGFTGLHALITNLPTWLTYQRVYRDIQSQYNHITDANITEYYRKGALKDVMDETTFRNHLQISFSSGGVSDEAFKKMLEAQPAKLVNEAVKYSGLTLTDLQLAEFTDYVRTASVDMNRIFNKYYDRVNGTYNFTAIQKALNEYLEKSTSSWAEYLQPVAMQFMAKQSSVIDIARIPIIGRYYQFNQDMFSNIESYLRDTAAMYYIQHGETPRDAINQMLRTQFDYSDAGKAMETLNSIAPFATYKVMNLNYWLLDSRTRASAIRLAANLGTYQGLIDPMELAKNIYWTHYFKEHPEENTEEESMTYLQQFTAGRATNEMYVSSRGKWKISKNHYLKNSAPFFEASELWTQVFIAMTDYDYFMDFVADNIYSPISTSTTFFSDLLAGEVDKEYYLEHYYELNDMIPVLGSLINSIIGKVKAANSLNEVSVADLKALYTFGPNVTQVTMDTVLDVLSVTWSSMIGTIKDVKPVGYNWNEQSEEYKATHKFIFGVSALPTPLTKDPRKYVDHLGMFVELGYTKEEALELLTKGWYFDKDGNAHQYKMYNDEAMPDVFKYNPEVFDDTLRYLLGRGYDIDSAYAYMKTFGRWVDEDGNVRSMDDVELLWKNSLEKDRYYKLPAYIRNIPNQYSKQLAYYKALGYTSDEAKLQMQVNAVFIDDVGNAVELLPAQVAELNTAYKYNNKYQQDAEVAQTAKRYTENKVTGANKFKTYKTPETVRTEGGRQYQASSYPARYRRPKKIHHSFTYNTIYGINNTVRNRMSVALSHSHYRSAVRYKSEEIRNRFRYL